MTSERAALTAEEIGNMTNLERLALVMTARTAAPERELLPQDYPPPSAIETERLALGAILRDDWALESVPLLRESCFTGSLERWLWRSVGDLLLLDGWDARVRWIADRRPSDWQSAADLFWLPVPVDRSEVEGELVEMAKRRAILERCQQVAAMIRVGAVSAAGAWSILRGVGE